MIDLRINIYQPSCVVHRVANVFSYCFVRGYTNLHSLPLPIRIQA